MCVLLFAVRLSCHFGKRLRFSLHIHIYSSACASPHMYMKTHQTHNENIIRQTSGEAGGGRSREEARKLAEAYVPE